MRERERAQTIFAPVYKPNQTKEKTNGLEKDSLPNGLINVGTWRLSQTRGSHSSLLASYRFAAANPLDFGNRPHPIRAVPAHCSLLTTGFPQ